VAGRCGVYELWLCSFSCKAFSGQIRRACVVFQPANRSKYEQSTAISRRKRLQSGEMGVGGGAITLFSKGGSEMNKTWIYVVVLAAAGIGGYYYLQGQKDGDEAMTTSGEAVEKPSLLEGASDAVGEAAENAAGSVADAVEGAADTATEAAGAAAEAAGNAAEGATEAAGAATDAATDTATEAAASDAAATATETATDTAMSAGDLLNPENFDAGKVSEMIDGSNLDPLKKTMLKKAVEAAGDNPEMVSKVIDQIKSALGM